MYGRLVAWSGLLGGMIAWVGGLIYAYFAYKKQRYASANGLIRKHYTAEMLKIGFTFLAFATLFLFFRQIVGMAVFVGYLIVVSAYWFGLIFKFRES
jgi:F0F1-type ATP synthase assembly protein I